MKSHVIKSRVRFTLFIAALIIIGISSLNLLLGTTAEANGYTETKYQTIEVSSGDTLWDIVDLYMDKDLDQREAVYQLQEINDLDTTALVPGQKIKVPTAY